MRTCHFTSTPAPGRRPSATTCGCCAGRDSSSPNPAAATPNYRLHPEVIVAAAEGLRDLAAQAVDVRDRYRPC
ncbi:hypothetical protein GCM10009834_06860 [Streptomonospora arabica]